MTAHSFITVWMPSTINGTLVPIELSGTVAPDLPGVTWVGHVTLSGRWESEAVHIPEPLRRSLAVNLVVACRRVVVCEGRSGRFIEFWFGSPDRRILRKCARRARLRFRLAPRRQRRRGDLLRHRPVAWRRR